jgi:hypothetical protein
MFKAYRITDKDIEHASAQFEADDAGCMYIGIGVKLNDLQMILIGALTCIGIGVVVTSCVAMILT